MKLYQHAVILTILSIVLFGTGSTQALADDLLIIGISETNDKASQNAILQVLNAVVDDFPSGMDVEVYNATNPKQIAEFTIPDTSNARSRRRELSSDITPIINHLRESQSVRLGQGCELNLPAFFEVVGASLQSGGGSTRVLLIGSPFYSLNSNDSMNFAPGFYPNDRHIVSESSIFGTKDRQGSLDGVSVDFILMGEIGDDLERKPVRMFLAKWLYAQGATLTSFLPTAKTVIKRAKNRVTDGIEVDALDLTDPYIRILRVGESSDQPPIVETGRVNIVQPTPIQQEERVSEKTIQETIDDVPAPRTGYINIFAVWASVDGGADVDLWVKPSSSAKELYFNNKTTAEGRYLRDIRQSTVNQQTDEWKAAWEGVEIREGNLDTTVCWLNLYENTNAHVEGVVRVQFSNTTVDIPFEFDGLGNKAGDHDRRHESEFWIPIDLSKAISAN